MNSPSLSVTTNNPQVDDILCETIGILETTFPNRVRVCYLHGSFVNNTGIPTSDIDLFLVSQGSFTSEEREKIQHHMHIRNLSSSYMVIRNIY